MQELLIAFGSVLLGWVLHTFFNDWWQSRGKVEILTAHVWKRGSSDWKDLAALECVFSLRASNTYSSGKALSVERVGFYADRNSPPICSDHLPRIGYEPTSLGYSDVHVPEKYVIPFNVLAATPPQVDEPRTYSRETLLSIRYVCIEFHVWPGESMRCWYDLNDAID